jgi:hypothetical protein
MAKASPEPEKAPEPVQAEEPKPSVGGTWPKSEHILHAAAMYGHPQWLVEHVLAGTSADESLDKNLVTMLINDFLRHKMEVQD